MPLQHISSSYDSILIGLNLIHPSGVNNIDYDLTEIAVIDRSEYYLFYFDIQDMFSMNLIECTLFLLS